MQKMVIYLIGVLLSLFFLGMILNIDSTFINKPRPSVYIHIFMRNNDETLEKLPAVIDYYLNNLPKSHMTIHLYGKSNNRIDLRYGKMIEVKYYDHDNPLTEIKQKCLKNHTYKSWIILNDVSDNIEVLRVTEPDLLNEASKGVTRLNTNRHSVMCFIHLDENKIESDRIYQLDRI